MKIDRFLKDVAAVMQHLQSELGQSEFFGGPQPHYGEFNVFHLIGQTHCVTAMHLTHSLSCLLLAALHMFSLPMLRRTLLPLWLHSTAAILHTELLRLYLQCTGVQTNVFVNR